MDTIVLMTERSRENRYRINGLIERSVMPCIPREILFQYAILNGVVSTTAPISS
jgi:hypothetical protein